MPSRKKTCEALSCPNTNKNSNLSFFIFPKKDPKRIEKWNTIIKLKNTGKTDRFLCSDHFELSAFTNTFKNRLLYKAVPTIQRSKSAKSKLNSKAGKNSTTKKKRDPKIGGTQNKSHADNSKFKKFDQDSCSENLQKMKEKRCKMCYTTYYAFFPFYRHKEECWKNHRYIHACPGCKRKFQLLSQCHKHQITCFKLHSKNKQKQEHQKIIDRFFERSQRTYVRSEESDSSSSEENMEIEDPKYSITCAKCSDIFWSLQEYKIHLKKKGMCRPKHHACKTCKEKFHNLRDLVSHEKSRSCRVLSDHKAQFKKMTHVDKQLDSKSKRHTLPSKAPIPRFVCKSCENIYCSVDFLKSHFKQNLLCAKVHYYKIRMQRKLEKKTGIGQTARKSFSNLQKTMKHNVHSSGYSKSKKFEPEKQSAANFLNKLNKIHKVNSGSARKTFKGTPSASKNKLESPRYSCNVCKKSFVTLNELQVHKKKHLVKKEVTYENKCPECFEVFYDSFLFFDHQKQFNHWGKAAKSTSSTCKCPFCRKEFIHVRSRNAHLRNHADRSKAEITKFLKKTTCDVCSQIFVTESVKIQHCKIEHPEFSEVLSDTSDRNTSLKKKKITINSESKRKESEESPETQKYVGYSDKFKVMVKVTSAMKQRLRERPTECPVCFKRYSTQFIRNRHFRMHTLESAFDCQFCSTKFARTESLMKHMQQEHIDCMEFECNACNSRFMTKMRALQHATKVHPHIPVKSLIKERNINISPELKNKSVKSFNSNSKISNPTLFTNEVTTSNEDFYCDVCEISFLKLCGLQRHRQSRLHRDILEKSHVINLEKKKANVGENQKATYSKVSNKPSVPLPQSTVSATLSKPTSTFVPQTKSSLATSQSSLSSVSSIVQPTSFQVLKCSMCQQKFSGINEFVPHRLSHFSLQNCNTEINELNPYVCEICGKSLDSHQKVQLHLFWHLQDTGSQTNSIKNAGSQALPSENKTAIPANTGSQQVAKKSINKRGKQEQLVIGGVKKPFYTCNACNIGFTTQHHYSVHIRRYCRVRKTTPADSETGTEQVSSDSSNLSFTQAKFTCLHCSEEFKTAEEQDVHVKQCSKRNKEIMLHYCEKCSSLFRDSAIFQEHKILCDKNLYAKVKEDLEEKNKNLLGIAMASKASVVGCSHCLITFNSLKDWSEHSNIHLSKPKVNNDSNPSGSSFIGTVDITENKSANEVTLFKDLSNESVANNIKNVSAEIPTLHDTALKAVELANHVFESGTDNLDSNNIESKLVKFAATDTENTNKKPKKDEDLIAENSGSDPVDKNSSIPNTPQEKEEGADVIESLRQNFSRLLCVLISDNELMQQLGYGQLPIDDVLTNVLEQMGQTPVANDESYSDLERLRLNIRQLLDICIKDQVMELIADEKTTTDTVVIEALKIFGAEAEEQQSQS